MESKKKVVTLSAALLLLIIVGTFFIKKDGNDISDYENTLNLIEESGTSIPIENIEKVESIDSDTEILKPYDDIFQLFHQNLIGNIL